MRVVPEQLSISLNISFIIFKNLIRECQKLSADVYNKLEWNKYRIHQMFSPISICDLRFTIYESRFLLKNIYYDFCFNWQTEEKILFWTRKKFVFYFNCSNWEKFVEKISETNLWKHLMSSLLRMENTSDTNAF